MFICASFYFHNAYINVLTQFYAAFVFQLNINALLDIMYKSVLSDLLRNNKIHGIIRQKQICILKSMHRVSQNQSRLVQVTFHNIK